MSDLLVLTFDDPDEAAAIRPTIDEVIGEDTSRRSLGEAV
jgi:hypothetical protein